MKVWGIGWNEDEGAKSTKDAEAKGDGGSVGSGCRTHVAQETNQAHSFLILRRT